MAAREGKREMVEELLSRGADIEAEDKSGWTALCTAVSRGYRELADILTEKGARRTEAMEAAEFFAAVKGGDVSTVESLIEKNPALVYSKNISGEAPLHVAAQEGHDAMVTFLVSRSADVNAGDDRGRTALHSAALSRQLKAVEELIAVGADANIKDRDGEKPSTYNSKEIADILRRHQTWE
ncbi:MAG: ankyrin repeat domain-containing protein [Vulcanimicrobiota bacterium]